MVFSVWRQARRRGSYRPKCRAKREPWAWWQQRFSRTVAAGSFGAARPNFAAGSIPQDVERQQYQICDFALTTRFEVQRCLADTSVSP